MCLSLVVKVDVNLDSTKGEKTQLSMQKEKALCSDYAQSSFSM